MAEDTDTVNEVMELMRRTGFSRVPVYREDTDNVVGIAHIKDLVGIALGGSGSEPVGAHLRDVTFVPDTKDILPLLSEMQTAHDQIVVVVDEYGGTAGIITIEDIVEELVGEIWDEYDDFEEELVKKSDTVYEVSGDYNVYDLMEELDPENRSFDTDYNTVSGWTLEQLEHIPQVGEQFVYNGYIRVTVEEMDEQRITKLKVELLPKESQPEEEK